MAARGSSKSNQKEWPISVVAFTKKSNGAAHRVPTRAFVCTSPNRWNYPAKDRAGHLEQIEKPHLGELIKKLIGPGTRKPFTVPEILTERDAQTTETDHD